jgi:hypothetical protein
MGAATVCQLYRPLWPLLLLLLCWRLWRPPRKTLRRPSARLWLLPRPPLLLLLLELLHHPQLLVQAPLCSQQLHAPGAPPGLAQGFRRCTGRTSRWR